MKNDGFPWTQIGPGPEPRMPDDFASRVIEKARTTRAHQRRTKFAVGAAGGLAAIVAIFLAIRPTTANQSTLAQTSHGSSYGAISDYNALAWNEQSAPDPLTVLMPSAQTAAKFDTYYGAAGWDTYASWDSASYDSSQIR